MGSFPSSTPGVSRLPVDLADTTGAAKYLQWRVERHINERKRAEWEESFTGKVPDASAVTEYNQLLMHIDHINSDITDYDVKQVEVRFSRNEITAEEHDRIVTKILSEYIERVMSARPIRLLMHYRRSRTGRVMRFGSYSMVVPTPFANESTK